MPMQTAGYVASTVVLAALISACGSSTDSSAPTASLESATASGAIASIETCPDGAPARGLLKGRLDASDGAFGTIRNNTGSTLWLWSGLRTATTPCRLEPGQGAGYASITTGTVYDPYNAKWVPSGVEPGFFWVLATTSPDGTSPGVAMGVLDPPIGTPSAASVFRTSAGATCASDNVVLKTGALSEEREYRLRGNSQGDVLVKRFRDSKNIAREWTSTSDADDWARFDFTIDQVGRC